MRNSSKVKVLRTLQIIPEDRRSSAESTRPHSTKARKTWPIWLLGVAIAAAGLWFLVHDTGTYARNYAAQIMTDIVRPDQLPKTASSSEPETVTPLASHSITGPMISQTVSLSASGYVVARRQATVAASITGIVTHVLVEVGDVVKKGQILARLDSALAEANLENAQALVAAAKAGVGSIDAELERAREVLKRSEILVEEGIQSYASLASNLTEVLSLEARLEAAQANLQAAKAHQKAAEVSLTQHSIKAPFDGVVVAKAAQPGEVVSPISSGGFTRTGIYTLLDPGSLELEVEINETFISRVYVGQFAIARLDAYPDWDIRTRVISIVPVANRDRGTIQARIELLDTDHRIASGMSVQVALANRGGTDE